MERILLEPRILKCVIREKDFVAYETNNQDGLKVYVTSTPYTRDVINKPQEMMGIPFKHALRDGFSKAIDYLPETQFLGDIGLEDETRINVYSLLRGGLNAQITEALFQSKFRIQRAHHTVLAISSTRSTSGRVHAEHFDYDKYTIRDQSCIFMWDIVATGTSARCAMAKMTEDVMGLDRKDLPKWITEDLSSIPNNKGAKKREIKNIFFGSIGGDKLEDVLIPYHRLYQQEFQSYRGITITYMELIAGLASETNQGRIFKKENGRDYYWPGTDLLLGIDATRTPEFELSLYGSEDGRRFIAPCIIWDGGARGFSPHDFGKEMRERWIIHRNLAKEGINLWDIIIERNPWLERELTLNENEFMDYKRLIWQDVPEELINEIYKKQRRLFTKGKIKDMETPRSLEKLAND